MPSIYNAPPEQGMDKLYEIATDIYNNRMERRKLDLQTKFKEAELSQSKDDNKVAVVNARANLVNSMTAHGLIDKVDQQALTADLPFVENFTPLSKESRKAEGQKSVSKVKSEGRQDTARVKSGLKKQEINLAQTGKETLADKKAKSTMEKETFKQGALDTRQDKSLTVAVATNMLTPSELAEARQGVEETNPVTAERLRTGETVIVIPGLFMGIGKKTITSDDIINKVGSDAITPDVKQGFEILNKVLKTASSENKKKYIAAFVNKFPELSILFEE